MPVVPPAATTSSVVSGIIDRVYREWLTPAEQQPTQATLAADLTIESASAAISVGMLAPDEQSLISPGTVIEVGREQMLVTGFTGGTATVRRAHNGTTAATHDSGDLVVVQPRFARQAVFDAVADEVVSLHPSLWGRSTDTLSVTGSPIDAPDSAVGIATVTWMDAGDVLRAGEAHLLTNHPASSTGRAVLVSGVPSGRDVYITYKHEFPRPADEDDDLTDTTFRLETQWLPIVIVGAAARMSAYVDPTRLFVDWAANAEQTSVSPAGTATALHRRLDQMRRDLLDAAAQRQSAEYPPIVTFSDPFNPLTRT